MNKRVHLFIYGDVIGVGFRAWILRQAQDKHLTGWVRNTADDGVYRRVEALFEGTKDKLEEMIKRCQHGPEVAWVEKVDLSWENATGEFVGFEIRY